LFAGAKIRIAAGLLYHTVNPSELVLWRRQRRRDLLAAREATGAAARADRGRRISGALLAGFSLLETARLAIYWPVRGEFDPRFVARALRARGATIGLPVITGRTLPLVFREWHPGIELLDGGMGIPYPASSPEIIPDACLIPAVGFDALGFRLGYGAGFFDRTLAALSPRPLAIGTADESARIDTIFPQPHDIALDFMVTENGIHVARAAGLERIDAMQANRIAGELVSARRRAHAAAGTPADGRFSSPVCYARDAAPGYFGEPDRED
jgi:5,10-methenyltetrahydrofolate synthetase